MWQRHRRTILLILFFGGFLWFAYWFNRLPAPYAAREESPFRPSNTVRDHIPALTDPSFESVVSADQYLTDDGFGIDVAVEGYRRFYPVQVLVWHEAVNDTFRGKPLLVTFCPLCRSGAVYDRRVDGTEMTFGTAEEVWNSNILLYDKKTNSVWSQLDGIARRGASLGKSLAPYPSRWMTWADWKHAYPTGEVLSRNTGFVRDYTLDPYGAYRTNQQVWFLVAKKDDRLATKERVFGVTLGKASAAYPEKAFVTKSILHDVIAGRPVVAWKDEDTGSVSAFARNTAAHVLTFRSEKAGFVDAETESVWTSDGAAIKGPLKGTRLERLTTVPSFWFCWFAAHPDTQLYSR